MRNSGRLLLLPAQILKSTEQIAYKIFVQDLKCRNSSLCKPPPTVPHPHTGPAVAPPVPRREGGAAGWGGGGGKGMHLLRGAAGPFPGRCCPCGGGGEGLPEVVLIRREVRLPLAPVVRVVRLSVGQRGAGGQFMGPCNERRGARGCRGEWRRVEVGVEVGAM